MLPDQDLDVVERNIGQGQGLRNLCYIHRRCIHDVLVDVDGLPDEHLDLISMLAEFINDESDAESPYLELSEFFRTCEKTPVSLTFSQIEGILGDKLSWEAYFFDAFWLDDFPGHEEMWLGYPFHFFIPEDRPYCISGTWIKQGYAIKALYVDERRVVFRRVRQNTSGLKIPKALTSKRLPDAAVQELTRCFDVIIRKYGL